MRWCIVPKCPALQGKKRPRYQIPWKKDAMRKKWMGQLVKAGVPVDSITCHSRVCGIHFVGGSKSHKDDIPTLFPGKYCSDTVYFTATIFSHCLGLINSRGSSGRQWGVLCAIFMCTSARDGFPRNRSRRDRPGDWSVA